MFDIEINRLKSQMLQAQCLDDLPLCTQILGRGHDLSRVEFIVNYDMPERIAEYVHRIGRTGRTGHKGFSIKEENAPADKSDNVGATNSKRQLVQNHRTTLRETLQPQRGLQQKGTGIRGSWSQESSGIQWLRIVIPCHPGPKLI